MSGYGQGVMGMFNAIGKLPMKLIANWHVALGFGVIEVVENIVAGVLPVPEGNRIFEELIGGMLEGFFDMAKMSLYEEGKVM